MTEQKQHTFEKPSEKPSRRTSSVSTKTPEEVSVSDMAPRERLWAQLWAVNQMRINMNTGRVSATRRDVRRLTEVERHLTESLLDACDDPQRTLRGKLMASLRELSANLEASKELPS